MTDEDMRSVASIQHGVPQATVRKLREAITSHECYRQSLEKKYQLDPPDGIRNSPMLLHKHPALNPQEKREMEARTLAYQKSVNDVAKQAEDVARKLGIDPERQVGDPPLSLALQATINITRSISKAVCGQISQLKPGNSMAQFRTRPSV